MHSPEANLWREVLCQAVEEAVHGPTVGTHLSSHRLYSEHWQDARDYVLEPGADFAHVCHLAGLDPDAVRAAVARQCAVLPINDVPRHVRLPRPVAKAKPARPKREPLRYTHDGETLTAKEWSQRTGLAVGTIQERIHRHHWSVADALTKPRMKSSSKNKTLGRAAYRPPAQRTKRTDGATITHDGLSLTMSQWSDRTGISIKTIRKRLKSCSS